MDDAPGAVADTGTNRLSGEVAQDANPNATAGNEALSIIRKTIDPMNRAQETDTSDDLMILVVGKIAIVSRKLP